MKNAYRNRPTVVGVHFDGPVFVWDLGAETEVFAQGKLGHYSAAEARRDDDRGGEFSVVDGGARLVSIVNRGGIQQIVQGPSGRERGGAVCL